MSRAAVKRFAALFVGVLIATAGIAADPHLDRSIVEGGCAACHEGHGRSESPMLPAPQAEVCLSCHGSQASVALAVATGRLAADVRPSPLAAVLAQPFTHPLSREAFSRREPEVVTCTSCHTAHRGRREGTGQGTGSGRQKVSTRNPVRLEFELCQSCHGFAGSATQSFLDISRLTSPQSRSFHPLEAPAREASPSVVSELSGLEINCTDCHGNSDPTGPAGPHGSEYRYLLSSQYLTVDGSEESPEAYALCYGCHDREAIYGPQSFPLHDLHVVEGRASCATCHSAHGSVDNRSLVRFGEETMVAGVSPSPSTGRLAFVSDGPGSGACYLFCHGVDHAPESYGGLDVDLRGDRLQSLWSLPAGTALPGAETPRSGPGLEADRDTP